MKRCFEKKFLSLFQAKKAGAGPKNLTNFVCLFFFFFLFFFLLSKNNIFFSRVFYHQVHHKSLKS